MSERGQDATLSQIVRLDKGGVNARILAREAKVDFRRVEAASVKMPTRFYSAEGKRLFVRLFGTLQLNAHFVSVIARTRMDHDDIAKIEGMLRERIDGVAQALNQAIDDAEALFKANGITEAATYDAQPLELEVGVLSSTGRRYLEVIAKLDRLMPLLQTLEVHEVMSAQDVDRQRAQLKRQVRDVAHAARTLATGLRRRMNAAGSAPTAPRTGDGVTSAESGLSDEASASSEARAPEPDTDGVPPAVEPDIEPGPESGVASEPTPESTEIPIDAAAAEVADRSPRGRAVRVG